MREFCIEGISGHKHGMLMSDEGVRQDGWLLQSNKARYVTYGTAPACHTDALFNLNMHIHKPTSLKIRGSQVECGFFQKALS